MILKEIICSIEPEGPLKSKVINEILVRSDEQTTFILNWSLRNRHVPL